MKGALEAIAKAGGSMLKTVRKAEDWNIYEIYKCNEEYGPSHAYVHIKLHNPMTGEVSEHNYTKDAFLKRFMRYQ